MSETAIASPDDPGTEWDGVEYVMTQEQWDEMRHQTMHEHYCGAHVCPVCGQEEPYRDRSPREEWVSAWQISRELHR